MRIVQFNTYDGGGGAERIAMSLLEGYNQAGHDAWLAVNTKRSGHSRVIEMREPDPTGLWAWVLGKAGKSSGRSVGRLKGAGSLARELERLRTPGNWLRRQLGYENYPFLAPRNLFDHLPALPDFLHLHNLHGGNLELWGRYFDLHLLAEWSRRFPVLLTLHDAWLLSGHCGHSMGCQRWLTGCGACPDLTIYPAIQRDATAHNWHVKAKIYRDSKFHVATPSRWLMEKVEGSMLRESIVEARVIHNGVDLNVFKPAPHSVARAALDLPAEALVLLFAGTALESNPWKDIDLLREGLKLLADQAGTRRLVFLALGSAACEEQIGHATLRFVPFESDPARVAFYYQAADVYLHPARADTFPTAVIESLACGRPVVATRVGGIPEQIDEGQTGFLIAPGDAAALASAVMGIVADANRMVAFCSAARNAAEQRFDEQLMIRNYLAWIGQIAAPKGAAVA